MGRYRTLAGPDRNDAIGDRFAVFQTRMIGEEDLNGEGISMIGEVIFGIIMRKVIRRGSFQSVGDLRSKLMNFIEYFNRIIRIINNERVSEEVSCEPNESGCILTMH